MAGIFSVVSLRGMMLEEFGTVVIIPALLCIALVIVGVKHSGNNENTNQ